MKNLKYISLITVAFLSKTMLAPLTPANLKYAAKIAGVTEERAATLVPDWNSKANPNALVAAITAANKAAGGASAAPAPAATMPAAKKPAMPEQAAPAAQKGGMGCAADIAKGFSAEVIAATAEALITDSGVNTAGANPAEVDKLRDALKTAGFAG